MRGWTLRWRVELAVLVAARACSLVAASGARAEGDGVWGAAANGLQARVVAVAPETDEQASDFDAAERVASFARPEQITLLVELKNAGDKPINLQGVRYGESVSAPHQGRSYSDHFAPHLFECEFFDAVGKRVEGPANRMHAMDAAMIVAMARAESLAPGASMVMLLRPGKWDASVTRLLTAGDYTVRVHYRGPLAEVLQLSGGPGAKLLSPDAWTGDAAAGDVKLTIDRVPAAAWREPVWGEPVDGLRAAVEFRNAADTGQSRVDTASSTFPYGARVDVQLLIENVNEREISFWSEDWRQGDQATLVSDEGEEIPYGDGRGAFYSGMPVMRRWTLRPGQVAALRAIAIGVAANNIGKLAYEHPIGTIVVATPGEYGMRYEIGFGGTQRRDANGKQTIPGEGDFQGTLTTGLAPFAVREWEPKEAQ